MRRIPLWPFTHVLQCRIISHFCFVLFLDHWQVHLFVFATYLTWTYLFSCFFNFRRPVDHLVDVHLDSGAQHFHAAIRLRTFHLSIRQIIHVYCLLNQRC